jgi:hypothetical protein
MSLKRFIVYASFPAWSPEDRDHPERRIFIAPGARDLFTDGTENRGSLIKFLRNGLWYEAARSDFEKATTAPEEFATAQRGA